ncbi:MAG: histidine phosphatase family protein, partial [Acutalibacteraceae bacterium]|nr:histidine phosphatase family protein [Acutalibacteraceae bacterium]
MRILIIRHGDPDYSIDSLTEKGFLEANLLADRLEHEQLDDIYCSIYG